jgi:hypothetical protein
MSNLVHLRRGPDPGGTANAIEVNAVGGGRDAGHGHWQKCRAPDESGEHTHNISQSQLKKTRQAVTTSACVTIAARTLLARR